MAYITSLPFLMCELSMRVHAQLRRLINESEDIASQRDELRKRLTLLTRAQSEIAAFA